MASPDYEVLRRQENPVAQFDVELIDLPASAFNPFKIAEQHEGESVFVRDGIRSRVGIHQLKDNEFKEIDEIPQQQTLHILRGNAALYVRDQSLWLRKGDMVVVPPGTNFAYSDAQGDFLNFSLASKVKPDKRPDDKKAGTLIFRANLFDLLDTERNKPVEDKTKFMSTHEATGDEEGESLVQQIVVFKPEMMEDGYDVDSTQAGRILVFPVPVPLDVHTHDRSLHSIYKLPRVSNGVKVSEGGRGLVLIDRVPYEMTHEGDVLQVPQRRKHQLASVTQPSGEYEELNVVVINDPGIDPDIPGYSTPAKWDDAA